MGKRQIILNLFSMKFCVDLEKHIVRNMLYIDINFMAKFVKQRWVCWFYSNGFVKSLKDNLFLAILQAYGFCKESIRLFLNYLTNRTQRNKIGSTLIIGQILSKLFRKFLHCALYFLIFLSMTCPFSQQNVKSVILLMKIAFIFVV